MHDLTLPTIYYHQVRGLSSKKVLLEEPLCHEFTAYDDLQNVIKDLRSQLSHSEGERERLRDIVTGLQTEHARTSHNHEQFGNSEASTTVTSGKVPKLPPIKPDPCKQSIRSSVSAGGVTQRK